MCAVCRQSKEKNELLRIVRNKDGEIFIDPLGKANGRGAYICKDGSCINEARQKKAFERSFKEAVSNEFYSSLEGLNKID